MSLRITCRVALATLVVCLSWGCGSKHDASPRRVHVNIIGQVQGVGFRAFTQDQAQKLGLGGYVLNRQDGSVEAVVEGPNDKVEQLLAVLRRGPDGARVDSVQVTEEPHKGQFSGFEVRR